jgi:hypothetical protein
MTWHATWIEFNSMNSIKNVKVNSNWIELNSKFEFELNWIELNSKFEFELNWIELNWTQFFFSFWTQHDEGSQCWSLNWIKFGVQNWIEFNLV